MATLAAGISTTEGRIRITTPGSPRIGATYRIGDELVKLETFWKGTYQQTEGYVWKWVPDTTAWRVERGAEQTVALSHDAGTAVEEFVVTDIEGGDGGGATVTMSDTDPGAIGAGNIWLQTDDAEGNHDTLMTWVRNADDDGWLPAATGAFYTGGPVTAQQVAFYDVDTGRLTGGLSVDETATKIASWSPASDPTANREVQVAFDGFKLNLGPAIATVLTGTADPSAGGGLAATAPALYIRDNSGVTELWIKTGAGDTAWTALVGL